MHRAKLSAISFTALALGSLISAPAALSQTQPPGTQIVSGSVTGVTQLSTNLDQGGSFNWYDAGARLNLSRQFNSQFSGGVSVGYSHQGWSWGNTRAFGGSAPWQGINNTQIGLNLGYNPSADLRLGLMPIVQWRAEDGVGTAGSAVYGGVITAAQTFSPSLTLGLGAGVFKEFDQTKTFPFLVVNWKITPKLTLANPLPAGPAGGAGLELTYELNQAWKFGLGGSYRQDRFRLNNSGSFAGGVGQNTYIPIFARASYSFTPMTSLDFYLAAMAGGQVKATSADGSQTLSDNYSTGVGLGLNLSHRF
jgi:hypothetical protein